MLPPPHAGSIPLLSVNSCTTAVSFFLQAGLAKDGVRMETSDLNLKSLKDLACNFVDRKVSQGRELRPEGGWPCGSQPASSARTNSACLCLR